jgi:PRC-barrel domain
MYLRRYGFLIPVSILGGFMLSPLPPALAAAQTVQLSNIDAAVVGRGVRASKLIGSTVMNDRNERIGSLDDIIIDEQGQLSAVLEVGGFLGLGGRRVALLYSSLKIDSASYTVTIPGASKEQLEKAPAFEYKK